MRRGTWYRTGIHQSVYCITGIMQVLTSSISVALFVRAQPCAVKTVTKCFTYIYSDHICHFFFLYFFLILSSKAVKFHASNYFTNCLLHVAHSFIVSIYLLFSICYITLFKNKLHLKDNNSLKYGFLFEECYWLDFFALLSFLLFFVTLKNRCEWLKKVNFKKKF